MLVSLLALCALIASGYLAWHSLSGQIQLAGCGGKDADCGAVIQTRWGSWFGIPVSMGGVIVYGSILALTLKMRKSTTSLQWLILLLLTVIASTSALWFIGLQVFEIKSYCLYCMAVHASGLFLAVIILRRFPLKSEKPANKKHPKEEGVAERHANWVALAGLASVAVIAMSQIYSRDNLNPAAENVATAIQEPPVTPSPAHASILARREVALANGKIHLNVGDFPLFGSSNAENIVVHFFDFTCPSCRKLHPTLMSEHKPYTNQTALVMVPVPLDAECNPEVRQTAYIHRDACALARVGLALWKVAPQAYSEYDRFLFQNENPPSAEAALAAARELAGKNSLDSALSDSSVLQVLRQGMMMFYSPALIQKGLPALVTKENVFTGFPAPGLLPLIFSPSAANKN